MGNVARTRTRTVRGAALSGLLWVVALLWCSFQVESLFEGGVNDFGKFHADAQAFVEGRPMYELSDATEHDLPDGSTRHYLNLNPPHFHLVVLPLAPLSRTNAGALWLVLGALALVVSVVWTRRVLGAAHDTSWWLRALPAAFLSAPFGAMIITGQVTFALLPLVTWAWIEARRERWSRAALALGVGLAIKPFLLLFVPWLLARGGVRSVLIALGAAFASFGVGVAVFGVEAHASWLAMLGSIDWYGVPLNASTTSFVTRTTSETHFFAHVFDLGGATWWIGVVSGAAVAAVSLWDSTRDADTDRAFTVLSLATVLASPLGWIYYLPFALPSAIGLWSRGPIEGRGARISLRAGLVLLFVPTMFTMIGQPDIMLTFTLGSAHFWATGALWLALMLDGRRAVASSTGESAADAVE